MKRKIIYISVVAAVALAILIVSLVNRFKDRNKYTDVVITGHDHRRKSGVLLEKAFRRYF